VTAAAAGGLQAEVVATLIANGDGWRPAWAACTNAATDTYGNHVSVHYDGRRAAVCVEFEYALGGIVEVLHLAAQHGAARIAAVIQTLAAAPADDRADQ
jgi:hypothetical protein